MTDRPTFVDIALKTANIWSLRSEDPYRKVGACVLNKEGRVLSIGYNGLTSKLKVHEKIWNDRDKRRAYVIHAEVNALALLKKQDEPHIIATTLLPCSHCATNIACYGIKYVVYNEEYERDQLAKDIFRFYDIKLIKM